MSKIALSGNASGTGTLTIASPNTNTDYTLSLPASTTTLVGTDATQTLTNKTLTSPTITGASMSSMASSVITSGTAVASTSGTSIDFTSIPSWVKRITVMFSGVSTNSSSFVQIQVGAGSITTSGYVASSSTVYGTNQCVTTTATSGFVTYANTASDARSGHIVITNVSSNIWVASGVLNAYSVDGVSMSAGTVTLGGTLDRVRITTVNGTDTFDAGSINIFYE